MILYDTIDFSGARMTNAGYLAAEAKVARTGIQLYSAAELGLVDGDPARVIRVYRPPEEVFAADAMASYAHRPVTVGHPPEMVDASNWKEHARGQTGAEVLRDGEFVRVPMLLMDSQAIDEWRDGKRQLSMGYTMDLKMGEGVTDKGEKFDATQINLRMNHLALVSRARGGSKLRLGDNKPEDSNMSEVKLTTILVDGLSVETTEPGATAISKLISDLVDAHQVTVDAAETHKTELATKDTELATKDAEIDTLKKSQLSDEDLDRKVKDRGDLIAKAKQIADKDYAGMSKDDIRKSAVAAKLGQDAITDKSAEYISARFDILVEDAGQDPVRKILRDGEIHKPGNADEAHAAMVTDMTDAWKGDQQKGGA